MVTAASELARNAWEHGGGGTVRLESLNNESRRGLRLTFSDQGAGIADVEQALKDGYTTGGGMGLGWVERSGWSMNSKSIQPRGRARK
jgi:Anti-sigma regulatory factor (Ser/Thr protein kinase)